MDSRCPSRLRRRHRPTWTLPTLPSAPPSARWSVSNALTAFGSVRIRRQTIEEKLGLLLILILADPDGNEVCLVSRETFEPASAAADDFQMVSVSHVRSQILRAYSLRA